MHWWLLSVRLLKLMSWFDETRICKFYFRRKRIICRKTKCNFLYDNVVFSSFFFLHLYDNQIKSSSFLSSHLVLLIERFVNWIIIKMRTVLTIISYLDYLKIFQLIFLFRYDINSDDAVLTTKSLRSKSQNRENNYVLELFLFARFKVSTSMIFLKLSITCDCKLDHSSIDLLIYNKDHI
jgi:hypothetical protein